MIADNVELASPTIRRQSKYEFELDHVVLRSVFAAKETAHLRALLEQDVYADKRYAKLPKYRQIALEAYFRGVVDAVSRIAGVTAPMVAAERPKSHPPKSGKNKKRKNSTPPKLYPSPNAPSTPVPSWVSELPPPGLLHRPATIVPPSPFPPASDLGVVYGG